MRNELPSYTDLEDTKPDCPAANDRVRSPAALEYENEAAKALKTLEGLPSTTLVRRMVLDLRKLRDEFRSWQRCDPTFGVRRRAVDKLYDLAEQVQALGEREESCAIG